MVGVLRERTTHRCTRRVSMKGTRACTPSKSLGGACRTALTTGRCRTGVCVCVCVWNQCLSSVHSRVPLCRSPPRSLLGRLMIYWVSCVRWYGVCRVVGVGCWLSPSVEQLGQQLGHRRRFLQDNTGRQQLWFRGADVHRVREIAMIMVTQL